MLYDVFLQPRRRLLLKKQQMFNDLPTRIDPAIQGGAGFSDFSRPRTVIASMKYPQWRVFATPSPP